MILVTGGTGLVGSHLLVKLTEKNALVRATYRTKENLTKTETVFKALNAQSNFKKIEWVKADLLDYFSLENIFDSISHVYHTAAKVSFAAKDLDVLMATNIDGTANLVNISLEKKIQKFCYVSSVASLGSYPKNKAIDEKALWQHNKNTSNYSVSKYYAENEVWRASEEGLPVVIINPATIIGFGNWTESSSTIIKKVYDGLSIYPSGGNAFVGVNDVVKSMILLMESNIVNERYLVTSENLSFLKLFSLIAINLNKKSPKTFVPKKWAKLAIYFDSIRSFFSGKNAVITSETVETAYSIKNYSNEKIKSQLDFKFEPMKNVVQETCNLYLADIKT